MLGVLGAAIVEGATSAHLRQCVIAGLSQKLPMRRLYQQAASGALKARGLDAPKYQDVINNRPGVVRKAEGPSRRPRT